LGLTLTGSKALKSRMSSHTKSFISSSSGYNERESLVIGHTVYEDTGVENVLSPGKKTSTEPRKPVVAFLQPMHTITLSLHSI